jgi:cytochrome c oxidase subunit 4
MSSAAATLPSVPSHDHGHDDESKFQIYVRIAMLLAVITGMEIVGVYLPFPHWFIFGALVVLSAVKFMFVILFFIHLRWDKPFCTILFFIGLVLAAGTVWALLLIFGDDASKPLARAEPAIPVATARARLA